MPEGLVEKKLNTVKAADGRDALCKALYDYIFGWEKPLMVHGLQTMNQLESSGVLGTVKIRKAGFPVRPTYRKFLARFKMLATGAPKLDAPIPEIQAFCKKVIEAAGIPAMKAQCGKTMMFLKNEANQQLEVKRGEALKKHIDRLNACSRAKVAQYIRRRKAWAWGATLIQEEFRDWLKRFAAQRAEREAKRKALLEALKEVLGPFDDEWSRTREEIRAEEEEAFAAIQLDLQEALAGMLHEIMSVVENGETTGRRLIEQEEDDAWRALSEQRTHTRQCVWRRRKVKRRAEEERIRKAIEEAWWAGGVPPPPPPLRPSPLRPLCCGPAGPARRYELR
eukprot:gene42899-42130_t